LYQYNPFVQIKMISAICPRKVQRAAIQIQNRMESWQYSLDHSISIMSCTFSQGCEIPQ